MIRALLIALVLGLSACTTAPEKPLAATGSTASTGVATLALWGTWEMELAPAYTRQIVLLKRAGRALRDGQIAVSSAIAIRDHAVAARRLLDDSRRGNATQPTALQRASLADALHRIALAEQILERPQ